MMPVNQVILGSDPLLGNSVINNNIEEQLKMLEQYKHNLELARNMKNSIVSENSDANVGHPVWDSIDNEIDILTDEQKNKLFNDIEYVENYNGIQKLVNNELLNLVKSKIENTKEGKELLENQLKNVKKLKVKIIEETDNEIKAFKKFKEYSKNNPELTYEEFIKSNL